MENNQLYNLLSLPGEVVHKLDKYGSTRKDTFNIDIKDLIKDPSLEIGRASCRERVSA